MTRRPAPTLPVGPLRAVPDTAPDSGRGADLDPDPDDPSPAAADTGGEGRALVWTIADACTALQCSRSWLYDEVEAGRFPVIRLGRQLRFRPADITRWLDDHYQPARDTPTPRPVRPRHRRRPTAWPPT